VKTIPNEESNEWLPAVTHILLEALVHLEVKDLVGCNLLRMNLLAYAENHGLINRYNNTIVTNEAGLNHILSTIGQGSFVDEDIASEVHDRKPSAKLEHWKQKNAKRYTINGESLTLKEWSIRSDIPEGTLIKRFKAAGELAEYSDRIISKEKMPGGRPVQVTIEIDGVSDTVTNWCKKYGLAASTYHHRVQSWGWDKVEALITPVNERMSRTSRMKKVGLKHE